MAAAGAAYFAWRSLRSDDDREARRQASGLIAWWVHGPLERGGGKAEVWGLIVYNSSPIVFQDVEIEAVGNSHKKAGKTIGFRTLPPGEFFVESMPYSAATAWGLPERVVNHDLSPLTNADKRRVHSIRFTDMAARRWVWGAKTGLATLSRPWSA